MLEPMLPPYHRSGATDDKWRGGPPNSSPEESWEETLGGGAAPGVAFLTVGGLVGFPPSSGAVGWRRPSFWSPTRRRRTNRIGSMTDGWPPTSPTSPTRAMVVSSVVTSQSRKWQHLQHWQHWQHWQHLQHLLVDFIPDMGE